MRTARMRDELRDETEDEVSVTSTDGEQAHTARDSRMPWESCDVTDGDPANFQDWSKVARWTIEEATALSFGIEPAWVAFMNVKDWLYPCGLDYKKRLTLGLRAREAGNLQNFVAPIDYIEWAKSVGIPFPAELERMVQEVSKVRPVPTNDREHLNPKTRQSLEKILLGVAIDKFGYNPTRKKNSATGLMQGCCERAGISIDQDTVSKRLEDAARRLEASGVEFKS